MLVAPLILCSITAGVCSIGDMSKLKRIGLKTFLYFICTTAGAAGSIHVHSEHTPARGAASASTMIVAGDKVYEARAMPSLAQTIVEMFPNNIFSSLTNGTLVQIIAFFHIHGRRDNPARRQRERALRSTFE